MNDKIVVTRNILMEQSDFKWHDRVNGTRLTSPLPARRRSYVSKSIKSLPKPQVKSPIEGDRVVQSH